MTTNQSPRTTDRQFVFESLFQALCEHHHGRNIRQLAAEILKADNARRNLVALLDNSEGVVYFDTGRRSLEHVRLDSRSLFDEGNEMFWGDVGDAASWVDCHKNDLAWVHPRYRWVLAKVDQRSTWRYRE